MNAAHELILCGCFKSPTSRVCPVSNESLKGGKNIANYSGGLCRSPHVDIHSLAFTNDGLYAWGHNSQGDLGDGTTENRLLPMKVQLPEQCSEME
jgi:alpha-tubulin suppressor-like RCC1 family protein